MFITVNGYVKIAKPKKVGKGWIATFYIPKSRRNRRENGSFEDNNTFGRMYIAKDSIELNGGEYVVFSGTLENSRNSDNKEPMIIVRRSDYFRIVGANGNGQSRSADSTNTPQAKPPADEELSIDDLPEDDTDGFDLFAD